MFFVAGFSLVFSLVMGCVWLWRGMRSAAVAAVLWLVYAVYELLQFVRLVCAGNCDGSIDYFLFWPLLVLMTAVAIKQSVFIRE